MTVKKNSVEFTILCDLPTEFFSMKDKYSITKKWERKIEEMKKKADFKYSVLLRNRKQKIELWWEHEIEKYERKKNSEIKKKEEQMIRKMNNEIREFEWKPKREYKSDLPKIKPLELAMRIAQENSKLRDTDENGNWRCISCNKMCSWGELAWGHRYSRRFKNMCLEVENINAQCHTCNFTTWPRGDTVAKEKTNAEYDKNINIKFWPKTSERLSKMVTEYFHGKGKEYDLEIKIPELIDENEKLWATKSFYAPAKKRRNIRTKFKNRI